jgi:hypothetical protein
VQIFGFEGQIRRDCNLRTSANGPTHRCPVGSPKKARQASCAAEPEAARDVDQPRLSRKPPQPAANGGETGDLVAADHVRRSQGAKGVRQVQEFGSGVVLDAAQL